MANKTATTVEVNAERIQNLITREEDRFRAARRKSDELWRKARASSPRGVPSSFQDSAPQPIFIDYGRGSRIWDVDGNEYVDFHNGFGVMVVGHAHPLIVDAVSKRIARGSHFAQPVADDAIVAEELARRFGLPQFLACPSGGSPTAAPSPPWTRFASPEGSPAASGWSRSRPRITAITTLSWSRSSRPLTRWGRSRRRRPTRRARASPRRSSS
jgi:hypothetical protein